VNVERLRLPFIRPRTRGHIGLTNGHIPCSLVVATQGVIVEYTYRPFLVTCGPQPDTSKTVAFVIATFVKQGNERVDWMMSS